MKYIVVFLRHDKDKPTAQQLTMRNYPNPVLGMDNCSMHNR